jgi:YesN/AraC family two-component response regulator
VAKILIIDDDAAFRKMFAEMLTRAGYSVALAVDGRQGIDLYRAAPADLVITDILMPEKEGMTTVLELQEEFPDVRIIMISGGQGGNAGDYFQAARRLACVKAFLSKPFSKADILRIIKEVLG